MKSKELIRKWSRYFNTRLNKGESLNQIRLDLITKHSYKASDVEKAIYAYNKEKARQKKKDTAVFASAIILLAVILATPFLLNRPSITGMPVGGPGNTYYVSSTTGSDTNDGTSSDTPWKSLAKVQNSTSAYDTAYFKRGDIWRETLNMTKTGVTYTAYGSGNKPAFYASVNGSNSSCWNLTSANIYTYNCSLYGKSEVIWYNTSSGDSLPGTRKASFSGLGTDWDYFWNNTLSAMQIYLSSGNPGSAGNGVEMSNINKSMGGGYNSFWFGNNVNDLVLDNLEFDYTQDDVGVVFWLVNNGNVTNCDFKYAWNKALEYDGDNSQTSGYIFNNTFYRDGQRGSPKGRNAQGENIFIGNVDNVKIINNTLIHPRNVGINYFHTNGGLVENNTIRDYESGQYNISQGGGAIYFDGCNNTLTQNNVIISCGASGLDVNAEITGSTSNNVSFIYNVVSKCASGSWVDGNQGSITNYNINVSHNTFFMDAYTAGEYQEVMLRYFSNLTFKDNIIINNYTTNSGVLATLASSTGFVSDYNTWNSTIGRNFSVNSSDITFSTWKSYGYDTNGQTYYVIFNNINTDDYRPVNNSPACTMSSTGSFVGALPCAGGSSPECGDDSCNGDETCSTCEADCGVCPPVNNPPTQSTPILNASDNPYNTTDATLTCYNQSTADADGDPVTNNYRWFRNSSLVSALTTNSVNAGNTTEGETWKCEVTPYDGTDYGTAKNSSALTINQLPDTKLVKINSSAGTNYSSENLSCYANSTGFMTSMTVYYRLFNGSVLYASGSKSVTKNTLSTITNVSSSLLAANQTWKCSVKSSYDGVINESEWNNASLTIRALPTCGDGTCNSNESCSTCNADCGTCPVNNTITACTLSNKTWNENEGQASAYNLSACFNDSLNHTLSFSSVGNSSIVVSISSGGIVNLSQPVNWTGVEHVVFTAADSTNSSRSASANNITLTVSTVSYCGDSTCDSNETCSTCSNDCGTCPVTPFCGDGTCNGAETCSSCSADCGACSSSGGGGGGSTSTDKDWTCGEWSSCANGMQTQECTHKTSSAQKTNTQSCVVTPTQSQNNSNNIASSNTSVTTVTKETNAQETTPTENNSKQPQQQTPGQIKTSKTKSSKLSLLMAPLIVAFLAISLFIYGTLKNMRGKKKQLSLPAEPGLYNPDLSAFIRKAASKGHSKHHVRSTLLRVGWPVALVESLLQIHDADFVTAELPAPQLDIETVPGNETIEVTDINGQNGNLSGESTNLKA